MKQEIKPMCIKQGLTCWFPLVAVLSTIIGVVFDEAPMNF